MISNSIAGQRAHESLGYRPRRWIIIPNGFDPEVFRPDPDAGPALRRELLLPDQVKLVGMLARFHVMKDHATFINAAAEIAPLRGDVHFVAAGRGIAENPSLHAQINGLGLRGRVHLLPERSDVPTFLAGLDIAISSSYSEAFPNIVGESMACGTPCVVTDVGDSSTIVGAAGVVVPPRHPSALAAGIMRILSLDAPSGNALKESARSQIIQHFSLESVVAQYERLYVNLAAGATDVWSHNPCAE